jgi:hypothetical protein
MEPTGGYEKAILKKLIQAGVPTAREHALRIYHHAKVFLVGEISTNMLLIHLPELGKLNHKTIACTHNANLGLTEETLNCHNWNMDKSCQ